MFTQRLILYNIHKSVKVLKNVLLIEIRTASQNSSLNCVLYLYNKNEVPFLYLFIIEKENNKFGCAKKSWL